MIVILICSISHRDWFNFEFYLTLNILLTHEAGGEQIFYEKEIKTQMSQLFFLWDLHEKRLISAGVGYTDTFNGPTQLLGMTRGSCNFNLSPIKICHLVLLKHFIVKLGPAQRQVDITGYILMLITLSYFCWSVSWSSTHYLIVKSYLYMVAKCCLRVPCLTKTKEITNVSQFNPNLCSHYDIWLSKIGMILLMNSNNAWNCMINK